MTEGRDASLPANEIELDPPYPLWRWWTALPEARHMSGIESPARRPCYLIHSKIVFKSARLHA